MAPKHCAPAVLAAFLALSPATLRSEEAEAVEQTFALRHITGQELTEPLEKFKKIRGFASTLEVDAKGNVVKIAGPKEEQKEILDALQSADRDYGGAGPIAKMIRINENLSVAARAHERAAPRQAKTAARLERPAEPKLAALATAPIRTASYQDYQFYADRYRDPFIPLVGGSEASYHQAVQVASLTLKGIVADARGRMALLQMGSASYILRQGRLYDGQNKMVKRISGVIKAQSVVLIGGDRTVREIRLTEKLF